MEEYPSCKQITELSFEKFSNLLKNNATNIEEWNVLSTIVQYNKNTKYCKVIALGTGTKCIGVDKMCPNGTILNDSHAEVMCRRSFIRYIYNQMLNSTSNILKYDESKCYFILNTNITFHFFSTHPPCGDATIIDSDENQNDSIIPSKKLKLDSDYVCTGAKILGVIKGINAKTGEKTDPLDQDEGALRTKPGRGVRTLSMSCSDKLAKWNILGIQGALLDLLLENPIYFVTLNFCCETQKDSIERAVYNRWKNKKFTNDKFHAQQPDIRIDSDMVFPLAKLDDKKPSSRSLSWCYVQENAKALETAVNGKQEGITKKTLEKSTLKGALLISKCMLSKKFIEITNRYPAIKEKIFDKNSKISDEISYADLKKISEPYQNAWSTLKTSYFGKWTNKQDDLLNFKIKL